MKRHRVAIVSFIVVAPILPIACSGGDDASDSGADSGKDSTALDAAKDVTLDVLQKDATADVTIDATVDAPLDAIVVDAPVFDSSFDSGEGGVFDGGVFDANLFDGNVFDSSVIESGVADAGFVTPTCDGVVSAAEYGGAFHVTTSGSQTWYVGWDATNLYIGLDNATLTEAAILYVGYSGSGLMTAQVYDGTGGSLPFAADGVVYAKSGYQESRIGSIDAGTSWGTADTTSVQFCASGSTRELVIPWTALHASSVPWPFDFLAYATSGSGFVYGQIPTTNPSGNIGTSATFGHYFLADAGAWPFSNPQ